MRILCAAVLPMLLLGVGGCSNKVDPLEDVNRVTYAFNDGLDKFLLKPASDAYKAVIPRPVRGGITNAFDNLGYLNVIANDLLQGRFDDALNGTGRMAVNSTVGLAGFLDPATKWGMPARRNDFGITLGKWGVGQGPYLVLPLYGPSTARDVPAIPFRSLVNPLNYVTVDWRVDTGLTVVDVLNTRAELDPALRMRDRAAVDPYVFTRDYYIQMRNQRIRGTAATRPAAVEPGFYDEEPPTPRITP